MQTDAREATSDTALPLLRAGPVNAAMPDQGAPLMCNAPRNGPGGLGANKPPRWSAERRASPGAQTVKASLRGDARAYVTGPLTNGCRCTRAPVGAPLPSLDVRETGKLGGRHDSRER